MTARRIASLFFFSLCLSLPVSAQVSYRVVAMSNQPAPGTNGAFFGPFSGGPYIDENGRACFTDRLINGVGDATINNYDCVYSDVGGTLHLVARQGSVTPGNVNYVWGTNSFTSFGMSPSGQVVFHGVAVGNLFAADGLWAQNAGGGVNYVAIGSEDVPGLPGDKYETPGYNYPTMSVSADVPFTSILKQGVGDVTQFNDEILMVSTGGGPYRIVAREGDPVPSPLGGLVPVGSNWGGGPHQFGSKVCMNGGAVTFTAYTSGAGAGDSSYAIFTEMRTMAALRVVAGDQQHPPGLGATTIFGQSMGDISVNSSGNVAFTAQLQGPDITPGVNDSTIWMEGGGALNLVARLGESAPGGGVYDTFLYQPQLSNDGWVAYASWLKVGVGGIDNSNNVGIWIGQNQGTGSKIMRKGDPAPGLPAGYTFGGTLILPAINNSHRVAFNASIRGGAPFSESQDDSIWATDADGNLVLVAAKGQTIAGVGVISGCGRVVAGTAAQDGLGYQFNNSNQLAFSLNNETTIVVATIGGNQCVAPNISVQPISQSVCNGGSVSLAVNATGTAPLQYQWRRGINNLADGGNISGATSAMLTINPVAAGDAAADYNCVVSNGCGSPASSNAQISLSAGTTITNQPAAKTVTDGEAADFLVTVTGSGTPNYQWRRNGTAISNSANVFGATSAHLIINPAHVANAGNYDVVITSACGGLTSAAVSLTVNPAPPPSSPITTPPPGSSVTPVVTPSAPGTNCGAAGGGGGACGAGMMTMLPVALGATRRKRRKIRARRTA